MTASTDLLAPGGAFVARSTSASRLFWERFRDDKAALFAASVIFLLALIAFFGGPLAAKITGHPNTEQYQSIMQDSFGLPKGPNGNFWFGADGEGRDLFVRTMYGARTSLLVGVVASGAPTYALSFAAGKPVSTNAADTMADGLATRVPAPRAVEAIQKGAERVVTVDDHEIRAAMRHLFTDTHNLAEGAGAATLAALLKEKDAMAGKRVAIVLSGGNIDRALYAEVLSER